MSWQPCTKKSAVWLPLVLALSLLAGCSGPKGPAITYQVKREALDDAIRTRSDYQGLSDDAVIAAITKTTAKAMADRLRYMDAPHGQIDTVPDEGLINLRFAEGTDTTILRDALGRQGHLAFREVAATETVLDVLTALKARYGDTFTNHVQQRKPGTFDYRVLSADLPALRELIADAKAQGGIIPDDLDILYGRLGQSGGGRVVYVLHPVLLELEGRIQSAVAEPDRQRQPDWAVYVMLKEESASLMRKASMAVLGKRIAIVFDREVLSAPVVNDVLGSNFQITGSMTEREAQLVAAALRAVPYPLPVTEVQMPTSGARP